MKFIGIIPARYASTRFPGKPLVKIGDKTMIERVYRRVQAALDEVIVATDDERIYNEVKSFGGDVVMTSTNHRSGTDRCYEAYCTSGSSADTVINIQGDEPFINPSQIEALKECFDDEACQIATLVKPFNPSDGFDALFNNNTPKVTIDDAGYALYFSRSIIPYVRDVDYKKWADSVNFYTHIGLYGYKAETLAKLVTLPQSSLELAEKLEQLRWLQAGYRIRTAVSECKSIGIDTPEDLQKAIEYLNQIGE